MSVRVILLCGGKGSRWNNYRGTPKHLLEIEGEVLLERTYRQFSKYTDDIVIVADEWLIDKVNTLPPLPAKKGMNDLVKIWSSHYLWTDSRTVLVFGDVYFTDDAVRLVMMDNSEIKFLLRNHYSSCTGKEYREIFALAFNCSLNKKILDFINSSLFLTIDKGGWFLFEYMKNPYPDLYINIDDWTEDFDSATDLLAWEIMRATQKNEPVCITNNCLVTA